MPLDHRAQRLLDMLATVDADGAARQTPQQRRDALRALAGVVDGGAEAVGCVSERHIPGPAGPIGLRIYTPASGGGGDLPGLVFFHGGGWVAGDLDTHDGLCRRLANETRRRLIAVDYRLAPEHPFPAGLDDCVAAVRWLAANGPEVGIDPEHLAVGGDSAGGGLAAAVCQIIRDQGGPRLDAQLLICPILDISRESASRREFADGYFISRAALARDIADYCPAGADRPDPRVSPARAADLSGLPRAIVHTAEFDPFRDEGELYGWRLSMVGVSVEHIRHAGMIHYFYAMPRAIPHALAATAAIGTSFRDLARDAGAQSLCRPAPMAANTDPSSVT